MGKLPRTCKDCGAPVGADLRPTAFGCWFWGQMEERFKQEGRTERQIYDWRHCGGDPPCEGNAYTLWSDRRDRRSYICFFVFVVITILLAIGTGFL